MKPFKPTKIHLVLIIPLALIVIFALWFFWRSVHSAKQVRNILLISIDTCRSDYLSCYGCPLQTTPNIDRIAQQGIVFANVISPVPITLPAHSSMLTGTVPPYHGVHDNFDYQLGQSNVTLAEILKDNGFTTGAIVSAFVLDSAFGIDQGFGTYNDQFEEEHLILGFINERKAQEASRFAIDWLTENKDERFFLFLHYFDPHLEYEPPEPFATRFKDDLYAGEVAYTDYCIGKVIERLKELRIYDSTLIIVTGDHGEMLGEHGEDGHCYFIYQSAIKVPLIFRLPGQTRPRKVETIVSLIDIVPTICSLLGIEQPAQIQGIDLSGYFGKHAPSPRQRYIYCESLTPTAYNGNSLLGVVTDRWKYIQTTRPELYDLTDDPAESNNLVASQPHHARILQDRLKQILEQTVCEQDTDSKVALDEQARRRLQSLGYVGGSVSEDFEFDQSKDDPKDLLDFHNRNGRVNELISKQKYAQASSLCQQMLKERPGFIQGYSNLAKIAMKQDDFVSTVSYLQQALVLDPNRYQTHNNLGITFSKLGEIDKSISHCKKALQLRPQNPTALNTLALVLESQGKLDEAIECFEKVMNFWPNKPDIPDQIGSLLAKQGKLEQAISYFNKALALNPRMSGAHYNLAQVLRRQRKPRRAITHYEKALLYDPSMSKAYYSLGNLYQNLGQFDEAIVKYNKALDIDPDWPEVHCNLGVALSKRGRFDEAITHYEKALALKPDWYEAITNLEIAKKQKEKFEKITASWTESLEKNPNQPDLHNKLGTIFHQTGDLEKAVYHWRKALKLKPDWPGVLNNLALVKVSSQDSRFHNPVEAVEIAQRACELTDYRAPVILKTLAAAYAAVGKSAEAVKTAEKALNLAQTAGREKLAAAIERDLKLYEKAQIKKQGL